mmetsp:Transcript_3240/g.5002  ORF Transcript_3240/g.5002 Transcript_3240/m.5002 type:complete len:98 (-) Transcript_3240:276-569(-)
MQQRVTTRVIAMVANNRQASQIQDRHSDVVVVVVLLLVAGGAAVKGQFIRYTQVNIPPRFAVMPKSSMVPALQPSIWDASAKKYTVAITIIATRISQ